MNNKVFELFQKILKEHFTSDWIIEQPQLPADGKYSNVRFSVFGKIYFLDRPKQMLTADDLENIWNLCNFVPAQLDLENIYFETFKDYNKVVVDYTNNIVFIPINNGFKGVINDDLMIRKHSIISFGYYPYNKHRKIKDTWK